MQVADPRKRRRDVISWTSRFVSSSQKRQSRRRQKWYWTDVESSRGLQRGTALSRVGRFGFWKQRRDVRQFAGGASTRRRIRDALQLQFAEDREDEQRGRGKDEIYHVYRKSRHHSLGVERQSRSRATAKAAVERPGERSGGTTSVSATKDGTPQKMFRIPLTIADPGHASTAHACVISSGVEDPGWRHVFSQVHAAPNQARTNDAHKVDEIFPRSAQSLRAAHCDKARVPGRRYLLH